MGRDDFIPQQHDVSKHPEHFRVFREAFLTKPRDEWFDYLVNAGDIAVAKILEIDDMPDDPQVQARNLFIDAGTVNGETVRQVGFGPKPSDTPASVRSLGVVTGQNTDEVLSGLGYSGAQTLSLRQQGAVA